MYLNTQISSMEERLKEEKNEAALLKKRSEMFMKVSKQLLLKQDVDTICDDVIENIKLLLKCDRASFFMYEDNTDELYTRIKNAQDGNTNENEYHEIRISASTGLVGHTCKNLEVVNVGDVYDDPRFNKSVDVRTRYRTKSVLCVPVMETDGSSILGVCQAINKIDNENNLDEFGGDDVEALQGFATQISVAAQNCIRIRTSKTMKAKVSRTMNHLEKALKDVNDEKAQLTNALKQRDRGFDIMLSLTATKGIDDLRHVVHNKLGKALDAERAVLLKVEKQSLGNDMAVVAYVENKHSKGFQKIALAYTNLETISSTMWS